MTEISSHTSSTASHLPVGHQSEESPNLSKTELSFARPDLDITAAPASDVAQSLRAIGEGRLPDTLDREAIRTLKNLGIIEYHPQQAYGTYEYMLRGATKDEGRYLNSRKPSFLEETFKDFPEAQTSAQIAQALEANKVKIEEARSRFDEAQKMTFDVPSWAIRNLIPGGVITAMAGLFMANPTVVGTGILMAGISHLVLRGKEFLTNEEIEQKKLKAEMEYMAVQDRQTFLSALKKIAERIEQTYVVTSDKELIRLSAAGKMIVNEIDTSGDNRISFSDYLTSKTSLKEKTPEQLIDLLKPHYQGREISPSDLHVLQKHGLIEPELKFSEERIFGGKMSLSFFGALAKALRNEIAIDIAGTKENYPEVFDQSKRLDFKLPRRGGYFETPELRREFRLRAIEDMISLAEANREAKPIDFIGMAAPDVAPVFIKRTELGTQLVEHLSSNQKQYQNMRSLFSAYDIVNGFQDTLTAV